MKREPLLVVAAVGLLTGCILGMAGSFLPDAMVRNVLWAIDSCGLILAAALLTLYLSRKGHDIAAAGFMIFAIAESIVFFSCAVDVTSNIGAFGTGACLWALALGTISSQRVFPLFVRCTGGIAAVLFTVTAFSIFTGHPLSALSKPLPFFVYPFYAATLAGWAWTILRKSVFTLQR